MDALFESFKYGLTPAIVIAVYLICVKLFDTKKELKSIEHQKEESKKTIQINAEIADCFAELNAYLKHVTKDILQYEDDKCTYAIKNSFKALAYTISKFATFTIIANNVHTNRKNIEDNIIAIVSSEFADIYNNLVLYHNDTAPVTSFVKEEWKDELVADLKYIIFDENCTKEDRIYNIHNKMNLKINNYINIVTKQYVKC